MKKNTRVIIGAVLILFIAMISFRFETLTGAVSQSSFESTVVFEVWPTEIEQPGNIIYGTVKTGTTNIKNNEGEILTYGKTYLNKDKKICIIKKITKAKKVCGLLKCKEDIRKGCVEGKFNIRTSTLEYGEDYMLKVWEQPYLGKRQLGKWVYGGDFTIKKEPIKYK